MNNPNPLIPQGSLLEQQAKGKPHLRIAIFIVAVHLVFLGGLLIQGCKREDPSAPKTGAASTNESSLPPLSQESLYATATNVPGSYPAASNPLPAQSFTSLPPLTAEPGLAPAAQEYVVIKGDSFYTIGRKFGVTTAAIAKANPGVDSTRLKIGQKLIIPAVTAANGTRSSIAEASLGGAENVYVVKSGDTLSKIAKAHGVSINDIKELNGLTTDRINAGQKLKLPAARTPASPATTPTTNPAGSPLPASGTGNP